MTGVALYDKRATKSANYGFPLRMPFVASPPHGLPDRFQERAARGTAIVPSLFVIRGNDQGTRYELEEAILRLGRDKSSSIHLHDTEVSRHHAEFRRTHRDYTVSDLNSSNGTFVNGKQVQPASAGQRRPGTGRGDADALHRAFRRVRRQYRQFG